MDQGILDYIAEHPGARREDIRLHVAPGVSSSTIWRALKRLVDEGRLEISGKGRATGYSPAGTAAVRIHPWLGGYAACLSTSGIPATDLPATSIR